MKNLSRIRYRPVRILLSLSLLMSGCIGRSESTTVAAKLTFRQFAIVANDSTEFHQIFGREASAGEALRLLNEQKQATKLGFEIVRPSVTLDAAQSFRNQLDNTDSTVVTVVGHNEDGYLRFTDGSSAEIAALKAKPGQTLAIISCGSLQYVQGGTAGLPTKLTYQVAYLTDAKFRAAMSNESAVSPQEAQRLLVVALGAAATELKATRLKYVAGIGVTGTGTGIYIYEQV